MRGVSIVALALISLAAGGCSKQASGEYAAADAVAVQSVKSPKQGEEAEAAAKPAPLALPMLAYTYRYALELPGAQVRPLLARHEQACAVAGPMVCQVMAADAVDDDGEVSATLKLRAQPAWLARFRAGIEQDAGRAGGRVRASGTDTEDLTRDIVDTEAALRAQTTLRDRLLTLLATRTGKLEELLKVEQELARVQGEIDATQSALAVMRARVQTSALTIQYGAFDRAISGRAVEPLKKALSSIFGIVMLGLATIVTIAAFLTPVALIAVPVWWFVMRHKRKKPQPKA